MGKNLFEEALAAEGVTGQLADLARSIYKQESGGGKNTKTSSAGAVGGMQIRPKTFGEVADKDWDINDPVHNARAGIRYLSSMYNKAGKDPELAAVGYYGGPGGMAKARAGIAVDDPRNKKAPNTLEYAQAVVGRMPKQSGSVLSLPDSEMPQLSDMPIAYNKPQMSSTLMAQMSPNEEYPMSMAGDAPAVNTQMAVAPAMVESPAVPVINQAAGVSYDNPWAMFQKMMAARTMMQQTAMQKYQRDYQAMQAYGRQGMGDGMPQQQGFSPFTTLKARG